MRTRDSSFPVAAAVMLLFAVTVAGGCAHVPTTPPAVAARPAPPPSVLPTAVPTAAPTAAAAPTGTAEVSSAISAARERPAWIGAAPAARVVALNTRDERRCRREAPLGSRVERIVCRTEAEERLRAEAAAERVRWGTSPTF